MLRAGVVVICIVGLAMLRAIVSSDLTEGAPSTDSATPRTATHPSPDDEALVPSSTPSNLASFFEDIAPDYAGDIPIVRVTRSPSSLNEKIEQELDKVTNFEFPGNPLTEVIAQIAKSHQIPILMDQRVLEDAGVAIDTEVSLEIEDVRLRSALDMLLEDVGGVELTYLIHNEILQITTVDEADSIMEVRIYDVRAFKQKDPAGLLAIIGSLTEGPWSDIDGVGGDMVTISGQLAVRQTHRMHREIEELLNNLLKSIYSGTGEIPE